MPAQLLLTAEGCMTVRRAAGEPLPPSVFDRRVSGPPSPRLRRTGHLSRDRKGADDARPSHVMLRHTRMRSGLRWTRQRAPPSSSRPSIRAGASCHARAAAKLFAAARQRTRKVGAWAFACKLKVGMRLRSTCAPSSSARSSSPCRRAFGPTLPAGGTCRTCTRRVCPSASPPRSSSPSASRWRSPSPS